MSAPGYSAPLPHARTKNDLHDIDRFLEQLQATVYETSNQSAAAGVQQPGVHAMHTGDYGLANHQGYRNSNSPPRSYHSTASGGGGGVGVNGATSSSMTGVTPSASSLDTPALTPASVSSLHSSAQSPGSSQGRASFSSPASGGSAMYPNLPAVTGMSDPGAGYPTTTSAPASGLASGFDVLELRRLSGGRLQHVAPARPGDRRDADTEMTDAGSRTPKAAASSPHAAGKGVSRLDPALRCGGGDDGGNDKGMSTPGSDGDDRRQEDWVENIRVIEALKRWVTDRLRRGDFEDPEAVSTAAAAAAMADDKAIEASSNTSHTSTSVEIAQRAEEKMADAHVKYPSLPQA